MKRINIILTCLLFVCALVVNGQEANVMTIEGIAVDTDGKGLSGVTIEASGGISSTTTGEDGTFTLDVSRWLKKITASAPGMHSKTIKLNGQPKDKLVFKMKANPFYNPVNLKGTMILKGVVLDKDGNGLSGAKIEPKGINAVVTSDADGTFSIEIPRSLQKLIISYPGLTKKATVYLHGRVDYPLVIKLRKLEYRLLNNERQIYSIFYQYDY